MRYDTAKRKNKEEWTMFAMMPYRRTRSSGEFNIFREMEELERRFFGDSFSGLQKSEGTTGFRTDISDQGDSYLLEADLPGFDKESIHLDLNEDTLTISAERHSRHEEEDKQGSYLCCERSYGQYQRSFDVSGIDTDKIKAKYTDGVLSLTLPKKAEVQPAVKRLEIE